MFFFRYPVLTVADDRSKQPYISIENWSDKQKREFQGKKNSKKDFIITSENLTTSSHS